MIWTIVDIGSKLMLAGLGAYLALKPPYKPNKRVVIAWVSAFVVFVSVSICAGVVQDNALEAAVTGGNNFAYIRVRDAVAPDGGNKIAVTTTGALPSLHIGFYPVLPDGTVLHQKQQWIPQYRDLPRTTFHPPISVKPGRWEIHFLMGERKWIEHLEFERSEQGTNQAIWVERNGAVIYQEAKDSATP